MDSSKMSLAVSCDLEGSSTQHPRLMHQWLRLRLRLRPHLRAAVSSPSEPTCPRIPLPCVPHPRVPQFRPVLRSSSLQPQQPSAPPAPRPQHPQRPRATLQATRSLVLRKAQCVGSRQLPGLRGEAPMLPFQSFRDNVAFPLRRETEQGEKQTGEGAGKHFVPTPKPRVRDASLANLPTSLHPHE